MDKAAANQAIVEYARIIRAAVARTSAKWGRALSDADHADLTSHAVVVLLERALPAFNGRISLRSYIYMVADRETRKQLAKCRATVSYDSCEGTTVDEDEFNGHVAMADESSVMVRVAANIECTRLQDAIAALPNNDRDLVAAIVGGTTREYARTHGLTPVQMTRAKAQVRKVLR